VERYALTLREVIADGIVHAIGLVAGLVGAAVLIIIVAMRGAPAELAAILTYSSGLLAMLGCSAAYNLTQSDRYRELLRRLDHAGIFVMIAGTYTPFTTLRLTGAWAVSLTAAVWSIAIVGVTVKLAFPYRLERLSIAIYLALGWVGLATLDPLTATVGQPPVILLAIGGALYSIGVVFHAWERLPFNKAIWHGFVVAAAGVHYAAIFDGVVVGRPPS
jgi:hemolysin III